MEGEEDEPAHSKQFSTEEEEEEEEGEEWCFICKDGGKLFLCDYENCPKAYHRRCAHKSKASLDRDGEHWECAWHSCYKCKNPSDLRCYVCPKSVCNSCLDHRYFFHIKDEYGLCNHCRELALVTEPVDDEELNTREKHFKEYFVLVKNQEGFDLHSLISNSAQKPQMKKSQNTNDIDTSVVSKKDVEDKRSEGLKKRKFKYVDVSDEEDVLMQSGPIETSFAAIIAENIKLVYLTKSLVLELLKEPESFEKKVVGSFVRVKSDLVSGGDSRSSNSYQLVQVVGVTKEDSTSTVKLQLVNVPCDVSVDLLSDVEFLENECEFLRKNVEDGLLKKPSVEELERKARDLHRDLTKDWIARELKTLPNLIDAANEKGRRLKLVEFRERKERLENESVVNEMMDTPPKVIAEVSKVEPVAENVSTMDDDKKRSRSRSRSLPKPRKNSIVLEDADKNKLQGIKSTFPNHTVCVVEEDDVIIQESFSHPIELQCDKTSSAKTSPKNSSLDDEALSKKLDGLNRPGNVAANPCFVSVPSKVINHIQRGYILSLNEIPISNYKELMIPIANGLFDTLRSLNIDYTQLYTHVKEYIRSSARLAHIDTSKNRSSVEELTAKYESRKSCYEKSSNAFNEVSKSLHTKSELSQGHVSRLSKMVEMSEEMEKSKKEMLEALDALDERRKKWLEEEKVKEDYLNAKAALDPYVVSIDGP